MKKILWLSGLITTFIYISCTSENSISLLKPEIESQIAKREVEDCDECPVDDCCCAIEGINLGMATVSLRLCGTSDGSGSCTGSATGSCSSFSGGGQSASLSASDPKFGFCMNPGDILYIQNLENFPINITLTCQDDIINPQTLSFSLAANSTMYFSTNGSCVVAHC